MTGWLENIKDEELRKRLKFLEKVVHDKVMPVLWESGIPVKEEEIQTMFWFWYVMRHCYRNPLQITPTDKFTEPEKAGRSSKR